MLCCYLSHWYFLTGKKENYGFNVCCSFISPCVYVCLTVLLFSVGYMGCEPHQRPHCPPADLLVLSEFSEGDHPPLQMYLGHLGSCSLIVIYFSYNFKFQRHLPWQPLPLPTATRQRWLYPTGICDMLNSYPGLYKALCMMVFIRITLILCVTCSEQVRFQWPGAVLHECSVSLSETSP